MEFVAVIVIAALVFGVCYLVDKGFTKLFRSQQQHMSGTAVRLNKRYATIGLIMTVLGLSAVFTGLDQQQELILIIGGALLIVVGIGLIVYYMTFGVFYDDDSFILTPFGKKSQTYRYSDIQSQQLYNNYGSTLIELHLSDGRSVQLQASMEGVYTFMDKAFMAWLRQTGKKQEDCPFYDPDNSCWFPKVEDL